MPRNTDPILSARGRIARAERSGKTEKADATRAELTALKLERHVREALASAPPMTDAQRQRIASILTGGAR